MEAHSKIAEKGRLLIPLQIRKALDLKVGDPVRMRVEDGELRVSTVQSRILAAQRYARSLAEPGTLVSEELIAERREAAKRELDYE